jgi:hypothetical protein
MKKCIKVKKLGCRRLVTALAHRGSIHLVAARLSESKALPVALAIVTVEGHARWVPNGSFRIGESLPRLWPRVRSVQGLELLHHGHRLGLGRGGILQGEDRFEHGSYFSDLRGRNIAEDVAIPVHHTSPRLYDPRSHCLIFHNDFVLTA